MSQLALRLPDSLHARARTLAEQDNTSLNQFIALAVAEKVSALETADFFRQRAARGSLQAGHAILNKVADGAPVAGDEMPQ